MQELGGGQAGAARAAPDSPRTKNRKEGQKRRTAECRAREKEAAAAAAAAAAAGAGGSARGTEHPLAGFRVPTSSRGASSRGASEETRAQLAELQRKLDADAADVSKREVAVTAREENVPAALDKTQRQKLALVKDVSTKHLLKLRESGFCRRGQSLRNDTSRTSSSGADTDGVAAGKRSKVTGRKNNAYAMKHVERRQGWQHTHRLAYGRQQGILAGGFKVVTGEVCTVPLEADATARKIDQEYDSVIAGQQGALLNEHGHITMAFDESKKAGSKILAVSANCDASVDMTLLAVKRMTTKKQPSTDGEEQTGSQNVLSSGCAMTYAMHLKEILQNFCSGGIDPKKLLFALMDSCSVNVGEFNGVIVALVKLGWPLLHIIHCLLHILHNAFQHAVCHGPADSPWTKSDGYKRQGRAVQVDPGFPQHPAVFAGPRTTPRLHCGFKNMVNCFENLLSTSICATTPWCE